MAQATRGKPYCETLSLEIALIAHFGHLLLKQMPKIGPRGAYQFVLKCFSRATGQTLSRPLRDPTLMR